MVLLHVKGVINTTLNRTKARSTYRTVIDSHPFYNIGLVMLADCGSLSSVNNPILDAVKCTVEPCYIALHDAMQCCLFLPA